MINTTIPPTSCINPTPVQSAGKLPVHKQLSSLPNMSGTIRGQFRPLWIGWIATKWKNGVSIETAGTTNVAGHLQPSEPEKLEVAMAGDRSWKFYYLYVDSSLILEPDDRCSIEGIPYRVIGKKDWKEAGFIRYRLHEDYTDADAAN